jgi:endo-1,4-beta-xylanase
MTPKVSSGWDWIIWTFEHARSLLSNSKLLINEYGIINDQGKTRRYIEIINILKEKNLIDGIVIQCHQFNIDSLSASSNSSILSPLDANGLPIYHSELDIDWSSESQQSQRHQTVFPALWESHYGKKITLLGYITGQTWKDDTGILNSNGNERQVLKWLVEYMASGKSHVWKDNFKHLFWF